MELSASNIGWTAEQDAIVLRCMADHGFTGLEIAPTRIIPERPYDNINTAKQYAARIKREYGLSISSIQSVWFGKQQRIVESGESRQQLLEYTKKAVCFADATDCRNLVFGCPRNRALNSEDDRPVLEEFLWACAETASHYGVFIALEANPPIYNTNYINTTAEAIDVLKRLKHPYLKLNFDFGTVIENGEALDWLDKDSHLISHVHISEPKLVPVKSRDGHSQLIQKLRVSKYDRFISIEMAKQETCTAIQNAIQYVSEMVGGV